MNGHEHKEKHPPGLYVLFFTEMWERFGFYSMLAMFVLYLQDDKQGFSWPEQSATKLYSIYLMSVYFTPLIGGWLADTKLGYRNSVLIGGFIFMIGYFLMTVPNEAVVYLALTCLVIGNGFFKPNVSAMVGHLYPEGSKLKDRAYNIFYMGINIGALLAPINAEIMVKLIGYNAAFAIAGFGMIVSVAILWTFRHHVERRTALAAAGHDGADEPPGGGPAPAARRPNPIDSVPAFTRIGALLVVYVIAIVFWMVFHQNGSVLTYWANDNTDWKVTGIISNAINPAWVIILTFPLVWFWKWLADRNMEPSTPAKITMGMFLCSASFCIMYFAAKEGESIPATSEKFATADFRLMERGVDRLRAEGVPDAILERLQSQDEKGKFVFQGKRFRTDEESSGERKITEALQRVLGPEQADKYRDAILKNSYLFKVSPLWLILAYAVMTLGELMFSPMGLSLVSKVAPIHLRGLMMGGWFVASSIGNGLTAIGIYYSIWVQSTFFIVLSGLALVMAVVLVVLLRPLQKAMPGV